MTGNSWKRRAPVVLAVLLLSAPSVIGVQPAMASTRGKVYACPSCHARLSLGQYGAAMRHGHCRACKCPDVPYLCAILGSMTVEDEIERLRRENAELCGRVAKLEQQLAAALARIAELQQ